MRIVRAENRAGRVLAARRRDSGASPSSAATARATEWPGRPSDESLISIATRRSALRGDWRHGTAATRRNALRSGAAHRITLLKNEVHEYYSHFRVTADLIELRNLLQTADLIVKSARARRESRGLHFNQDYPATHPAARDTILVP